MKIFRTIFILGLIALYFSSIPTAHAEDAEARQIMEKVAQNEEGNNGTAEIEMTLIDKNKRQRVRRLRAFNKTIDGEKRGISFVLYPADVKGTAFLQVRPKDKKESDQWLYMPDLKKTKRILSSGGAKKGSFMGSDFTYADMQGIAIDDYTYEFHAKQKEIEFNGHKHWVIKATPKTREVVERKGYSEILLFVRQDNYFIVRSKLTLKEGGTVKYMDIKDLKQIDGIWVPMETQMTTKAGDQMIHKTILKNTNVKFNQNLSDDLFTIRKLEAGL